MQISKCEMPVIVIRAKPPTEFGQAMMYDAARIVRRATTGNKYIRLTRLHRLLQQRFGNLSVRRTYDLIIALTRNGLIDG